ncbi:MAG: hypothetical protein HGB23_01005 [Chlorobiaceae bacterium]|nr:hypothetical protein [Chlorobiaceae bacterium]
MLAINDRDKFQEETERITLSLKSAEAIHRKRRKSRRERKLQASSQDNKLYKETAIRLKSEQRRGQVQRKRKSGVFSTPGFQKKILLYNFKVPCIGANKKSLLTAVLHQTSRTGGCCSMLSMRKKAVDEH